MGRTEFDYTRIYGRTFRALEHTSKENTFGLLPGPQLHRLRTVV